MLVGRAMLASRGLLSRSTVARSTVRTATCSGRSQLQQTSQRLFSSTALPTTTAAVHNPIHQFFHILDGNVGEPLSSLFLPEATLHVQKAGLVLSGEEIDAWCTHMRTGWGDAATLDTEGNIVISAPEPGLVVSHSTWTALVDGELTSYGTHADILEEKDGEWLFRRRVVRHRYAK